MTKLQVPRLPSSPQSSLLSRRHLLGGALAVAGSMALSACGGDPAPEAAGDTSTITVWYWDDSIKFAVDAFHAAQDKIQVNFQKLSWDDVHLKLITALAAGSGAPDVCVLDFEYLGAFSVRGGLVDLRADPFGAASLEKDFVASSWSQCMSKDGRMFAFPWDAAPGGLWYRADVFDAAGIESDPKKLAERVTSPQEWFALGQELTKKRPDSALLADVYTDVFWPAFLEQGQAWYKDGKFVLSEKCTPALALAAEADALNIDAGIDWWTNDWNAGVKKEAFVGMNIACWEQSLLMSTNPETKGKWRVIPNPGGAYTWGGGFYTIPAQSQKREAAWEFIKFAAATKEGQNTLMSSAGIFPAFKPAWDDPLYDGPVDFFGGQNTFRLWQEVADAAPVASGAPGYLETKNIVQGVVDKFNKDGGKGDPKAAMDAAQAQAEKSVPKN